MIGIPDEEWGKRLRAFIVPAPGVTLDPHARGNHRLEGGGEGPVRPRPHYAGAGKETAVSFSDSFQSCCASTESDASRVRPTWVG